MVSMPQYLLFCDAFLAAGTVEEAVLSESPVGNGRWHFVLERLDEPERFEAFDVEREIHRDRLALLAVVRGLEAIEHCGLVRLVTTSRYVDRGLRFGLPNWRDTAYQWESFGRLTPIRNADLWKRINAAMQFHDITSRLMHRSFMPAEKRRCTFAWKTDHSSKAERGHSSSTKVGRAKVDRGHSSTSLGSTGPATFLDQLASGPARLKTNSLERETSRENLLIRGADSRSCSAPNTQRVQWWEMAASWVHSANTAPPARVSLLTA